MLIGQIDGPEKSAPSLITAAPRALLWPAAMIVWGPGYVSDTHRHHSLQLVMAIEGRLLIRRDSHDQWMECRAALRGSSRVIIHWRHVRTTRGTGQECTFR